MLVLVVVVIVMMVMSVTNNCDAYLFFFDGEGDTGARGGGECDE